MWKGEQTMKKRIVILSLFVLILFGIVGVRIFKINKDRKEIVIATYEMNTEVPVEENFFYDEFEDYTDYSFCVTKASCMDYPDFLAEYDAKAENIYAEDEMLYPVSICDLEVVIKNNNKLENPESMLQLQRLLLRGTDYMISMDDRLFSIANAKLGKMTSFMLRPGTEMVIHLPFAYQTKWSPKTISTDEIKSERTRLVLSLYPIQKEIAIHCD